MDKYQQANLALSSHALKKPFNYTLHFAWAASAKYLPKPR